jgi:hypothetical protein
VAPASDAPPREERDETAPTFVVFASAWLAARRKRLESEKSISDLEWRLRAAIAHIGSDTEWTPKPSEAAPRLR